MTLEEAKTILNSCTRNELRDHAFGDREIFWNKGEDEVASGYAGSHGVDISIGGFGFDGEDAKQLASCGTLGHVERNDATGPDQFVQGKTMPGLTLQSVLEEICTPPKTSRVQDDWDEDDLAFEHYRD